MTKKEAVEYLHLERCEFDDECDFCDKPEGGSYCRLVHIPEMGTETDYYICGKCVIPHAEGQKKADGAYG